MTDALMTMAFMGSVGHIALVALGIGLLIFIHELGHFLAARWCGIKVDAFSMGFGPALISFRRGETVYRLSAIPLGGYVKFAGENPGEESDDPRSFPNAPVYKRAIVALSGPLSNFVLAFICFTAAFYFGILVIEPTVGDVVPGMPAAEAGVEPGDEIRRINGWRVIDFLEDVPPLVITHGTREPLTLDVRRDGQDMTFHITPVVGHPDAPQPGFPSIGIAPPMDPDPLGPAARAGFKSGDRVVAVNGIPLARHDELPDALAAIDTGEVTLTVRRRVGSEVERIDLDPIVHYTLGIAWKGQNEQVIGDVIAGRPADEAGMEVGDIVEAVDGQPFATIAELTRYISERGGQTLTFRLRRGESSITLDAVPQHDDALGKALLGIRLGANVSNEIAAVAPGSHADAAGLKPGDAITGIRPADAGADFPAYPGVASGIAIDYTIDAYGGRPVALTVERVGQPAEAVEVAPVPAGRGVTYPPMMLGIDQLPRRTMTTRLSLGDSVSVGFRRMVSSVAKVGATVRQLVTGGLSPRTLGGPILIAQSSYEFSQWGITRLISWLGFIGVNLGILNLLPVPVLDGGMLVMLGVEAVLRRRPPEKVVIAAQIAGFGLLLALMVFVMYNDIVRLISG